MHSDACGSAGGVSEFVLQAGISGSVNAGITGLQEVVDADPGSGVTVDARGLQIEALDVRQAAGARQDGIDRHRALIVVADEIDELLAVFHAHLDGFGIESDLDTVARKTIRKKLRGVAFFLGQKQRQSLHDGRLRAEAAERLCQLAAQWTAADHQQAARQLGQVEYVFIGHKACFDQAGNRRRVGSRARGDHRLSEAQPGAVHRQRVGSGEVRFTEKHIDAGGTQTLNGIDAADTGADAAPALHYRGKIDANIGGNWRAVVFGVTHLGVQPGRSYYRLRWYAADVQAAAAEQRSLDERDFGAHRCRRARRDQSRRTASDDHQAVAARRRRIAPSRRAQVFHPLLLVRILRKRCAWAAALLHLKNPQERRRYSQPPRNPARRNPARI